MMYAIDNLSMLQSSPQTAPGGPADHGDPGAFSKLLEKSRAEAPGPSRTGFGSQAPEASPSGGKAEVLDDDTRGLLAAAVAPALLLCLSTPAAPAPDGAEAPGPSGAPVLIPFRRPDGPALFPQTAAAPDMPGAQTAPYIEGPPASPQTAAVQPADPQGAPAETAVLFSGKPLSAPQGPDPRNDAQTGAAEGAAAQTPQPLFDRPEAVPEQVGEAPVLDTAQGDLAPQLARRVDDALQAGDTRVELRLSPEQLGTVTVELTRRADGSLHVALRAAGEGTLSLLERHSAELQGLLSGGRETGSAVQVEVRRQDQGQPPFDRDGGGQQQQQQQHRRREADGTQDFLHRLRLGLEAS